MVLWWLESVVPIECDTVWERGKEGGKKGRERKGGEREQREGRARM